MKYSCVFIGLVICLSCSGQTNPKYVDTEYDLSDLKYNGIALSQFESIKNDRSPIYTLFPSLVVDSKEPGATWYFQNDLSQNTPTLALGVDRLEYLYWYRENGYNWDLARVIIKQKSSIFSFGNLNIKVGDNISVLSPKYPVNDLKSYSAIDSKHRVLIRTPKVTGGVSFFYHPDTEEFTEILFGMQIY